MGKKKIYEVNLTSEEKGHLKNLVSSGQEKARKLTRARILLKASEDWLDNQICSALDVSIPTIERIRKKYAEGGMEKALNRQKSSQKYERKIDGRAEAHLVALVCGTPPKGYSRWTLKLLSEQLVKLEEVEFETVSPETVRRTLKKTGLSLGKSNNG